MSALALPSWRPAPGATVCSACGGDSQGREVCLGCDDGRGAKPPAERWRCVSTDGLTGTWVLGRKRDWYARLADGRRWSITTLADGTAVLVVTEPNGWGDEHRTEHRSFRAARDAAARLQEVQ